MTIAAEKTESTAVHTVRDTSLMKRFWQWEASGVLVALIVLIIAVSLYTDRFLTPFNGQVLARQVSYVGMVALGQTLVLLIGGIDLSVGAAAGLCGIIAGLLRPKRVCVSIQIRSAPMVM